MTGSDVRPTEHPFLERPSGRATRQIGLGGGDQSSVIGLAAGS